MPAPAEPAHPGYRWTSVLWLTGVDYFSTLGYQPSIAFLAAGALAPIATAILVLVTLAAALPVYREVARHSFAGQGSIAMLERRAHGWWGKVLVLVLLGFAATDFVITMTLSAADAAQHAAENPVLHPYLGGGQLWITLALLALLAAVFLRGFHEAIGVAKVVGQPYILLNAVVIVRGLVEIVRRPELLSDWSAAVALRGDVGDVLLAAVLIFPGLALGLSGFETGVTVMPLVSNGAGAGAPAGAPPRERIRATRNLLAAAAVIMSLLLLGSSLVTTVLIPAHEFEPGGEANGRALAYLAHHLLGSAFGTVYDFVTILILWFAGASAMAGLLNLIPRYLPRFGMGPRWVERARPLVVCLFLVDVAVTLAFDADVDAQGGAYATGVLVLMLSAAAAVTIVRWREPAPRDRAAAIGFGLVTLVFVYVLVENVRERPDGVVIALLFILAVLAVSAISRWRRATELRVERFSFVDEESRRLFASIRGKKVNLVPLARTERAERREKAAELRRYYNVDGPIAFLHVEMLDDRSEFEIALKIRVTPLGETGNLRIDVTGAVAIANTIAFVSEQLDPKAIFLGLSRGNSMAQALKYLLWGEGEVGVLVYEILVRYWESTPEEDVRPLIFLVSD